MSTREVADLLGIPRSTVYELARRGDLPARRVGRRWLFLRGRLAAAITPLDAPGCLEARTALRTPRALLHNGRDSAANAAETKKSPPQQGLLEARATGLEPATSGVTGRTDADDAGLRRTTHDAQPHTPCGIAACPTA